jgi:hypothetical protein
MLSDVMLLWFLLTAISVIFVAWDTPWVAFGWMIFQALFMRDMVGGSRKS